MLLLIQAVSGSDALLPYSSALEAVLYFYAAGALIAYMLEDHEITRDELFAVGATFTLVAWAFAYSFTVCQAIEPNSFTGSVDPEADRTWMELLFLSFTVLSSTGLSDVVPVEPFARGLVMIEPPRQPPVGAIFEIDDRVFVAVEHVSVEQEIVRAMQQPTVTNFSVGMYSLLIKTGEGRRRSSSTGARGDSWPCRCRGRGREHPS